MAIGGRDGMEERGLSLAEIQEIPREGLTLVIGPPGAGKSAFCHQVVLNSIAENKPVIFVTTEQSPAGVVQILVEKGIAGPKSEVLGFVDAFSQTVGVETPDRPDTICADCADLNSISIATTRLQERMGQKGVLLAFDSLTSPYLFSGAEIAKFMRLFLSKLAAEGNSVLALMDEGCGKSEDLVAMMSVADGVIKMKTEENRQVFSIVKHPKVRPTRVEVLIEPKARIKPATHFDPSVMKQFAKSMFGQCEGGAEAVGSTLRGIPLFSSVSVDDLSSLSRQFTRRHYRKGEIIFHKGDSGSTLHIINIGGVKLSIPSEEGGDVFLAHLGPGDFFGELALLDERPRSATATAKDSTETLALERKDFLDFVKLYPDVAVSILAVLAQRIRNLNSQLESVILFKPQARLAQTLLKLISAHGSEIPGGWQISIPLTQSELAEMVGVTTGTIRRLLRDLQEAGIVSIENQRYVIPKPEELRRMATMGGSHE
jgi:CRP-like cAMP-binding protein/KaiC/GvpD/RAD55 family RecA-like ATPase